VRTKLGPGLFRLYTLNPMVGVIDGFRWSLLGGASPLNGTELLTAVALTAVLCVIGLRYFRQVERQMADYA